MANRMIFAAVLTLTLSLLPHLAHAFPATTSHSPVEEAPIRRLPIAGSLTLSKAPVSKQFGLETTQFTRVEAWGNRNSGLTLASPPPPKASPPLSIWEGNNPSPLLAPRYSRFEPGSLSDRLIEQAQHYLHTPYRRGCSLQTGRATDCSGFVQYIYGKANIDLPRASAEQVHSGKVAARTMDFSKLAAGDLLFFRGRGRHINHVGLYLGGGQMIHAASHSRGVTVSDLRTEYYQNNFVVAKRLLEGPPGRVYR